MRLSPYFFSYDRIIITDPAIYRQFKLREIYTQTDTVRIEQSAHPDILSEVKHFVNASNTEIHFVETESRYNQITLHPRAGIIEGTFVSGEDLVFNVPDSLNYYYLSLSPSAPFTDRHLDYILTWAKARMLYLTDRDMAALCLYKHIERLRAIKDLRSVKLNFPRIALEHITFEPFFRHIENLSHIEFHFERSVLLGEIEDFVNQQVIPGNFFRAPTLAPTIVAFDRDVPVSFIA